jgi:cytochrome P450
MQAENDQLLAMKAFFMPYGQGARVCLGIPFALVQIKLLVAFLLLEFEFHEDKASATDARSMRQLGTQSALPRGLRCDLFVRWVHGCSKTEEES